MGGLRRFLARINRRVLRVALPVLFVLAFWAFGDVFTYEYDAYRYEPVPRIEPGANIAAVGLLETAKIFDQDFSIRVLGMQAEKPPKWKFWMKPGPQSVSFRALGAGGFCREFTDMPQDQTGVYPGLNEVTIRFLGIFRSKARFEVAEFPKVNDDDLRIEQNQSVRVPGTDLVISLQSIRQLPPSTNPDSPDPESRTSEGVTYLAKRGSNATRQQVSSEVTPLLGEERFADQRIGQVVHFDNAFDIEVNEIFPTQVHFRVRAAAHLGFMAPGKTCGQ